MDGISSASSKVLKRLLFPTAWVWPTYSANVLGRILSANGVNWLLFDFCPLLCSMPFFWPRDGELECWRERSSSVTLFCVSWPFWCNFNLFEEESVLAFPAKLEELLFKAFVGGLVLPNQLLEAFSFFDFLTVDPSGDLVFPLRRLFANMPFSCCPLPPLLCNSISWLFRHLFACSFTNEAENERPQTGQSILPVCNILQNICTLK